MASVATLAVRITGDVSDVQNKLDRVAQSLDATADRLKSAGASLTAGLSLPLLGMGGAALKAAADNEQLEVAFTTMLQSAERATALMSDLSAFAAETPFESAEIQRAAKMLLAYGVEADAVTDNMRRLGDLAAGVGVRLEDLSYLYGTTMVQGRMYTADLNQFTSRGIPMIEALAETMGVATDEVKALVEEGAVGFPQMQAAIAHLTDEGGKFSGLMEAQSTTLAGLWSTLKDNVALTMIDIGDSIVQAFDLKGAAQRAIEGVESIRSAVADLAQNNPALLRTGVMVAAAAAALGPALVTMGMGVSAVKTALAGLSALAGVVGALSAPVLLLVGAVAALGLAWRFNWFGMREVVDQVAGAVTERWAALEAAFGDGSTSMAGIFGELGALFSGLGAGALGGAQNINAFVLALTGSQEAADATSSALAGAAEGIFRMRTSFEQAGAALAAFGASEAWTAAVQSAADGAASISAAVGGAFAGELSLADLRTTLLTELGEIGTAVSALFASDAFATLGGGLLRAFGLETLPADIGAQVEGVKQAFGPLLDFLAPSFARLGETVAGLPAQFEALGGKLLPLKEAALDLGGALGSLFGGPLALVAGAALAGALTLVTNSASALLEALAPLGGAVVSQMTTVLGGLAEVVSGLAAAFTGLITSEPSLVLEGLTTAFGGLKEMVSGTLENSLTVVQTALAAIGSIVADTASDWGFGGAATAVETLTTSMTTLLEKVKTLAGGSVQIDFTAPDWIGKLLEWMWPSLEAPDWVETLLAWTWPTLSLPDIVDSLLTWVWPSFPGLPGWVDDLMSWDWPSFDMPRWLDDLFNFKWPSFPALPTWLGGPAQPDGAGQLGITYARGGAYLVGEAGREIVTLPRGASVIPNRQTEQILGGGGGVTVVIQHASIGSEQDSWRLAYQIDDLRRRRRS